MDWKLAEGFGERTRLQAEGLGGEIFQLYKLRNGESLNHCFQCLTVYWNHLGNF